MRDGVNIYFVEKKQVLNVERVSIKFKKKIKLYLLQYITWSCELKVFSHTKKYDFPSKSQNIINYLYGIILTNSISQTGHILRLNKYVLLRISCHICLYKPLGLKLYGKLYFLWYLNTRLNFLRMLKLEGYNHWCKKHDKSQICNMKFDLFRVDTMIQIKSCQLTIFFF